MCWCCIFSGLIHANHGGNITDYLLNQVKDATSDVSLTFLCTLTIVKPSMNKFDYR